MKKIYIIGVSLLLLLTTFIPQGISDGPGLGDQFDLDEFMQQVVQDQIEDEQITNETSFQYREFDSEEEFNHTYVDYISGEVIVGLKPCYNISQMETFLNHTIIDKIDFLNIGLIQVDQGDEVTFIEELENRSDVYFAERNIFGVSCWVPNDPGWQYQWGPVNIKCPEAWEIEKGDSDVVIAVLDSGIDYNHPDLQGNLWVNELEMIGEEFVDDDGNGYVDDTRGWNAVDLDGDVTDELGHGTLCAGIAAAELNNGVGIAGVANVTIMPVVIGYTHQEYIAGQPIIVRYDHWAYIGGIKYAVLNDAWIISMSTGTFRSTFALRAVCKWAYEVKDCLLIAAAGNFGKEMFGIFGEIVFCPARYPSVICVSATSQEDEWYEDEDIYVPQRGDSVELAAPGNYTYTTMPTYDVEMNDYDNPLTGEKIAKNYDYMCGTSVSVPHVAGVAALYYSKKLNDDPSYERNPKMCRYKLQKTALDIPPEGRDKYTGYGLVRANEMVTKNVIYYEVVGNGTVSLTPDRATYVYNSEVQLTATPSLGWEFVNWSGDISSTSSQKSITVDDDKYIIATFAEED